jgi:hypothetical protein
MERVKGIEPSYAAWEAAVLPLNYTRDIQTKLSCALNRHYCQDTTSSLVGGKARVYVPFVLVPS